MAKRHKTIYPGVFYRIAKRKGAKGTERVYYIEFRKNGKIHEEKVGRQYSDDMTPARANMIKGQRMEGKRLSLKEIREKENLWTINKLWEEYKSILTNVKSLKTDESRYKIYLKQNFGDKESKELSLIEIDRLKHELLKTKAPQTVKNILSLLLRIINFGVKRNFCEKPSFHIEKPKVNNIKTEFLNDDQIKKLLIAIEEDDNEQIKNLMKMALYTGMRKGELLKLQWDDINIEHCFINIRNPKGGQNDKIPLNEAAKNVLLSHPKMEESPYVFPGKDGKQRVSVKRGCTRIRNRAGLPKDFRPLHGLRHTYASILASSGKVDMYTLQKLLTHKSPEMTQRYAHLRVEALKKASDLADELINGIIGKKKEDAE